MLLSGLVVSDKPACVPGRKAKLIINRPGETLVMKPRGGKRHGPRNFRAALR